MEEMRGLTCLPNLSEIDLNFWNSDGKYGVTPGYHDLVRGVGQILPNLCRIRVWWGWRKSYSIFLSVWQLWEREEDALRVGADSWILALAHPLLPDP